MAQGIVFIFQHYPQKVTSHEYHGSNSQLLRQASFWLLSNHWRLSGVKLITKSQKISTPSKRLI